MNTWRTALTTLLILAGLLLAACGSTTPTPDVEAAVETAIAQTRTFETAVAQSAAATVTANAPGTGLDTPESAPTDTPPPPTATAPAAPDTAAPVPTNTPPLPTDTPPPPTDTPSAAPPTQEKLVIAQSLVDGDDGNEFLRSSSPDNEGRVILLPSFEQSQVTDPVVFSDQIVFQVQVFDTRAGSYDGAGIQHVTFRIEVNDGSEQVVYERKEENAGYCAFGGGEPDCNVLVLQEGGDNRWPDPFGGEIISGEYLARIDIVPQDGEPTQWRWRFDIEVPGQTGGEPQPPDNTARINSITIQDGRYIVDFETFGFEPLLPGQHVHFFFDNVPPDQAGVPGSGPWQIYPTGPGQLNTSPFTLYTVDQRPPDATQICILVANADHSVNQGTGNCVDLP
jgi:hypothetical protein